MDEISFLNSGFGNTGSSSEPALYSELRRVKKSTTDVIHSKYWKYSALVPSPPQA